MRRGSGEYVESMAVQAMDGRSRNASPSSMGWVGRTLLGIVQQLVLVDWFDLSHIPTLHDWGPSLKSLPRTHLIDQAAPGFRFCTDAFSVHAYPVHLASQSRLRSDWPPQCSRMSRPPSRRTL